MDVKKIIKIPAFVLILFPIFLIGAANITNAKQFPGKDSSVSSKSNQKVIAKLIKKAYKIRKEVVGNLPVNRKMCLFMSSWEKLTYDITYSNFVDAGTAVLSSRPGYFKDNKVVILEANAKSAWWLNFLYHVNDDTKSYFSITNLYPYYLEMVRHEGKHNDFMEERLNFTLNELNQKNREIVLKSLKDKKFTKEFNKFKKYSGIALMKDRIESPLKSYVSYKFTQDSLSALYYLRMLNLKKGGEYYIPVFEHTKRYIVLVKALGYYNMTTPAGKFRCIKLKAYLNFNGVFSHKGSLDIYVTQRGGHIPVYLETKIPIGFISAILVKKE